MGDLAAVSLQELWEHLNRYPPLPRWITDPPQWIVAGPASGHLWYHAQDGDYWHIAEVWCCCIMYWKSCIIDYTRVEILFLLIFLISFFLIHGTSSSYYSNWWNLPSLKYYSLIECFLYISTCKVVLCCVFFSFFPLFWIFFVLCF